MLERVGWEDIMISSCPGRPELEGRRLSEIAAVLGRDPAEAAMRA
jgi:N-acyl-D-aspartate/D-glutamate deacylase